MLCDMSFGKFVGTFVQSTLFGGTFEDVAFEVRVLKGEVTRLHDRLDAELARLNVRLDELAGKAGPGRGKARLSVMSAAEAADAPKSRPPGEGMDAAPVAPMPPGLTHATPRGPAAGSAAAAASGADGEPGRAPDGLLAFGRELTIAVAFRAHPGAAAVFAQHHLPSCLDCPLSEDESLEQGATLHSLDVDALLRDLNQLTSH